MLNTILGDPGADSGSEGKSKRAEKFGTKKSKERREEPLGTMSYQTSSKRSPPLCFSVNNSPIRDYVHPDDHTQPTYDQTFHSRTFINFVSILIYLLSVLKANTLFIPCISSSAATEDNCKVK